MTLKEDQLRELITFLDSTQLEEDDKNYFIAQFHTHGKKKEIIEELNVKLREKGHNELPLPDDSGESAADKKPTNQNTSPATPSEVSQATPAPPPPAPAKTTPSPQATPETVSSTKLSDTTPESNQDPKDNDQATAPASSPDKPLAPPVNPPATEQKNIEPKAEANTANYLTEMDRKIKALDDKYEPEFERLEKEMQDIQDRYDAEFDKIMDEYNQANSG